MPLNPEEHDEADDDDVAGHLRMTDEQLASGATPSEAAAAAAKEPPSRGDAG